MDRIQPILDHFVSDLSQSSDHTKKDRAFYAEKFLRFAADRPFSQWNKTLVNEFLDQLRGEGYAPGTIRKVYGIVKRVFDSAKAVHEVERTRLITEVDLSKIDINKPSAVAELIKAQTEMQKAMSLPGPLWDVGRRGAPRVASEDEVKPAATFEQLKAMIDMVKDGSLGIAEAIYLILSSIYGLRREELCRVRAEHLDFKEKTIYVLTAKGGERRNQLLCDEVIPILKEYDFSREYSPFKMSALYHRISAKAGIELKEGSGWHSPRRYLDTELVNLFGQLHAHIFLRWKISSSSLMTERYYSEDPLQIDHEILTGGHPLVELWR